MEIRHAPVLPEETLLYLAPRKEGELMIDATLGEGGHSEAFLSRFPTLRIIGVDADEAIQAKAKARLAPFGNRINFVRSWSADFFSSYPADEKKPDTVLFDLGISMFHYEESGRGFSFMKDEPLDMRIDQSRGESAAKLIARLSEKDFADLLWCNAGERFSRRIARNVAEAKKSGGIATAKSLAEIVSSSVPAKYRHGPIHPATKTFQALRIAVNGELENLRPLLEKALAVLEDGGRMGVISFHSLEDRIVKLFFREKSKAPESGKNTASAAPIMKVITKKPVGAGADEIKRNPPSRSARLRVAEKTVGGCYE
jgi:16S rRNA (cytosine1402-N4)-methyltransferase